MNITISNYKPNGEHLKVDHLVVVGTSGWNACGLGYTYPNFMDALMPLASW
jgi:hypothetical protein